MDRPESGHVVVGVLGWVRASVDGEPVDLGGPRQQALLAVLAARGAGRTVANDVLVEAVWDGAPPAAAAETLRTYVARLRRSFDRTGVEGTAVLQTVSGGYRLDGAVVVDADVFESEVTRARADLEQGELAHALRLTETALGRWEGPAFDGVADRHWAAPAAVRLAELRREATELRARALLDTDHVAEASTLLEEHARAEPFRETAARLHALSLYRAGRDADALRVLREFRTRLVDDHGLDPSEQLAELEALILERDPRLDRPVVGRRLRGYVVHEPIATSPLGTVHRAEQPSIGREVAVTVLPPSVADAPDVVRSFETRLQGVAGLHHPHVLPVYDYWREPGGAYVVTRLPIATLREALDTGAVTAADALRIGEQVASAVAAAHERGIVHGAPDPDAVVVDERGDAYLWAFPLVTEPASPAADVAAVAALVTAVAAHDRRTHGAVEVDTLPGRARAVLARAADPTSEPVVTAVGLATALAAVRVGASEPTVATEFVGPNPYRGLAAFQEADADVFFGREVLVAQLLARLRRNRAVAVVGPSGAGKSSVVRAGVLPRLRADGAFVTTMVPGARPLDELEVALARVAAVPVTDAADTVAGAADGLARLVRRLLPTPGAELVLVVDQFEELFTQSEPTERDLFLAALSDVVADHDAPVRVVVTLRADVLGAALAHPTAARFVRDRTVMVAPLDDDELHRVIMGPAEVAGAAVEPALVTAIIADSARARGSLPMVQFALTEVFAAADDGVMRLETYRRIQGIEGVLGQRAEEVFASLDRDGQRAARLLFLRLVAPAGDGAAMRRRELRHELAHLPDEVIEVFGRARLLRFDRDDESREPTVEVGHEALFGAWPRLAAWIEEAADDLRALGHLTAAAAVWDEGGRQDADLYRGTRLTSALAFADGHPGQLSATELAFLDEAREQRVAEEASTRRHKRRTRRLVVGFTTIVVVVALVGGFLAADIRRRAQIEQATRDLAAAAVDVTAVDPELGMLLALEAVERSPRTDGAVLPEAASALHGAVTSFRGVVDVAGAGRSVDWHPDGAAFVTTAPVGSPGVVELRDAATGASTQTIAAHETHVTDVAFSPDGTRLATGGADGHLRVWDVGTEELVAEVPGRGEVWGISFSPDGARVAAAWHAESLVRVHDLDGGQRTIDVPAAVPGRWGDGTAFGPEGRRLAIAVDQGGVLVVDARDGGTKLRLDGTTVGVESLAWSPDGRWIAVGGGGGGPGIMDAVTGERHASLDGHDGMVRSLDWHADGERVATAADDGVIRVFAVTSSGAQERLSLATGRSVVSAIAYSPVGDRVVTSHATSETAAVWDLGPDGAAEVANLPTAEDQQTDAAFLPGSGSVVASGETDRAVVWDVTTGTASMTLGDRRYGAAKDVEVSPDGGHIVTVYGEHKPREVQAWDARTGDLHFTVSPADVLAWAASWDADGQRLAAHGLRYPDDLGTIGLFDRNGDHLSTLVGDELEAVQDVAFHPDEQQLITVVGHPSGESGRVLLWDTASQQISSELPVSGFAVAFDPSGTRIAVRTLSGGVSIWDAESAEQILDLEGHSGRVLDMAFSPDGRSMATSGHDGTIRLWSIGSGVEQQVLRGHEGPVWSVAFSPDGRRLVSTGGGLARVWTLDIDDLVEIAEARVTRSLTDAECRRYLDTDTCPV